MHQHGFIDNRLVRETLWSVLLLLIGVTLLPFAVFHIGASLFGPYAGGSGGMGSFYLALLDALASGRVAAWLLILAPLLCVWLLRLALRCLRRRRTETAED